MDKIRAYLRVSSLDQKERETIKSQELLTRQWFETQGIDPDLDVTWYRDDGVSGKHVAIMDRGDGKRLVADVQANPGGMVVVPYISRLSRNDDYFDFKRILKRHGVNLIGISENADLSKKGGEFTADIHAVIAAEYHRTLMESSKSGHERTARDGKWQGEPPYGYRVADQRLEIDEVQAAVVAQIFTWYTTEPIGYQSIADRLNATRVPTRRNMGEWSSTTVGRLLRNPAYHGEAQYNRTKTVHTGQKVRYVPRAEAEIIPIPCPAIIDQATWDRAQQKIGLRATHYQHTGTTAVLDILPRVYCANCGARMYFTGRKTGKQTHIYYRHEHRFPSRHGHCPIFGYAQPGKELQDIVWQEVATALRDPGQWLEQMEAKRTATGSDNRESEELRQVTAAIREIDSQLARLEDAYIVRGIMTGARYAEMGEKISGQQSHLLRRQAELIQSLENQERERTHESNLAARMTSLHVNLLDPTPEQQKAIAAELISRIRLAYEKELQIWIEWRV